MSKPHFFGAHVPISEGLESLSRITRATGITAAQIHPSAPQRWVTKPFTDKFALDLKNAFKESGLQKLFFHGIYLINLASPNEDLRKKSVYSLQVYSELLVKSEATAIVFHPGSITDRIDIKSGLSRVAKEINQITPILKNRPLTLLLEVSAGREFVVGSKLEHLREILDILSNPECLGIALDTQHLWASGYNIKENFEDFLQNLYELNLFEKIGLIHLNDSKSDLGSFVDRHENIGKGKLESEFFRNLFNDHRLFRIPMILETPSVKSFTGAVEEIHTCLKLMKN